MCANFTWTLNTIYSTGGLPYWEIQRYGEEARFSDIAYIINWGGGNMRHCYHHIITIPGDSEETFEHLKVEMHIRGTTYIEVLYISLIWHTDAIRSLRNFCSVNLSGLDRCKTQRTVYIPLISEEMDRIMYRAMSFTAYPFHHTATWWYVMLSYAVSSWSPRINLERVEKLNRNN